ncbi:hypothetical protein Patl1_04231 [Pistacia atlantica]|uniref:Uncharacterized protein n=1 Tax=Pistacia atlantica TaxID=434234 RepID=A0ACC1BUW0_9ROSI|nr:hypothetical protein Patl1_04231 [Pistacia atlantica]
MKTNTAEKWLEERIRKYGPISKLSLFGKPTVFICGQAANKFVFTSDNSTISNQQNKSTRMILGDRCLLELSGEDHKRVRDALVSFLKPESLKKYFGKIDEEVKKHLELHWHGKEQVTVLPLMKTLTFDIIGSLLFGVERGARRDQFVSNFKEMTEGVWAVPVNLPFHTLQPQPESKSKDPKHGERSYAIRDQDNVQVVTDKEIVDNVMLVMVAGHDTSSVLITFIMRLLLNDPAVFEAVLEGSKVRMLDCLLGFAEQEGVAKSKSAGELLTWEDLAKMKYTWRVAMETLRTVPPIFGGFRKALRDIEYGGYLIP